MTISTIGWQSAGCRSDEPEDPHGESSMTRQSPSSSRGGRRTFAVTEQLRDPAREADPSRVTVAIVGGGFSGTLLALHLLRRCPRGRVLLIERNPQFGRGLAYSTGNDNHLLNVPAGKMSAFQDRPGDFVDWLLRQEQGDKGGVPFDEGSFVPRRLFGTYVRHLLNTELKSGDAARLELLRGEVVDIAETDHLVLTLDRDRAVRAHVAVIAVGNFPPEAPAVADPWVYESAWYRGDPWAYDTLSELDPAAPVLLIGTGLTMVDTVMSLLDCGHRGPLHSLSRRGLLPRHHARRATAPVLSSAALAPTVSGLIRLVRAEIRRAREQGVGWQAVIDAFRPMTQELWISLPPDERARFLRHLRPWWDVHRHRVSPAIAGRIDAALRAGQLTVSAGRIAAYRPGEAGIDVEYRTPRRGTRLLVGVQRIINCAGPACDFDHIKNPLIQALLGRGQARPDALRLGLDVTLHGALRARNGAISQRLHALGPLTKGMFWEMTSVPDIRRQSELLAAHLAQVVAGRRFVDLSERESVVEPRCAALSPAAPWRERIKESQPNLWQ
jgi:uncharacterized NAD(P)/FAD-binding protein YdhS